MLRCAQFPDPRRYWKYAFLSKSLFLNAPKRAKANLRYYSCDRPLLGLSRKKDEIINFHFPRTRRDIFVARIGFLAILVAGIIFAAARPNFTSRASATTDITIAPGGNGRKLPSSKTYTLALKTSTLAPVCTTDPIVINNFDSGAGVCVRRLLTRATRRRSPSTWR